MNKVLLNNNKKYEIKFKQNDETTKMGWVCLKINWREKLIELNLIGGSFINKVMIQFDKNKKK